LQQVVQDRNAWPRELTVKIPIEAPIVVGGRVAGSIKLPAGKTYPVVRITPTEAVVSHGDRELTVAIKDTDLFQRADIQETATSPAAAPAPASAAASPTPANPATPATATDAPAILPSFTPKPEVAVANMPRPQAPNTFAGQIFSKAVVYDDGQLKPYAEPGFLDVPNILVLYSGWWNLPSRGMTSLIQTLDRELRDNPQSYRIVVASLDRDNHALVEHLREGEIEWPVIPPGELSNSPLAQAKPEYLPGLVLFSADGSVISQSYDGTEFLGHAPVMDALESAAK